VPTYEYACTNPEGKHQFEVVQSFTDAPVTECPECGAPVRKVYGSVGVVFKGSGFYRTDSRSGASASEGATKTETKTESNPSAESKPSTTAPKSESTSSGSSTAAAASAA
jgi:putative FmdB family regulatory protein